MKTNAVAKQYDRLTPEERFRLMLAAGARGDDAERDRLANAGERLRLSFGNHWPYTHAFDELATLIFVELVEEAGKYDDAFQHWAEVQEEEDLEAEAEEGELDEQENHAIAEGDGKGSNEVRWLDLYLAQGYMLKTKAAGWKLFCERMSIPPFALWEKLPGYDRLQRALAGTEKNEHRPGAAFFPEGFLRWMNRVRPAGAPELTEVPLTTEGIADETAKMFRTLAEWWSG